MTPDEASELAQVREELGQLRKAMESREVIDQARGMLMVLIPCTPEAAWDTLVDISQHTNIKLRTVASCLVGASRDEPVPEPVREALRRAVDRGPRGADSRVPG